jgi:hypothetical protein
MNAARVLAFCLAVMAGCFNQVSAQTQPPPENADENKTAIPVPVSRNQSVRLSPGAQEVARLIGVAELIELFSRLPAAERGYGSAMSQEALRLRLQLNEAILGASLEADGTLAEINSELETLLDTRTYLEAQRDRALRINTIANIVAGGAGGLIGTSLQFSEKTSRVGNIVGVAGGAVSTFLSVLGLRQQRGGSGEFTEAPNMLAPFFDRGGEYHARYPAALWQYFNEPVPTEPQKGTRRERLMNDWLKEGRLETPDSPRGREKIAFLTSASSEHRKLDIGLLNDREAMLHDIRLWIELMKRDLSKLMLAVRAR